MLNRGERGQEAQKLSSSPGLEEALQGRSGPCGEAWTRSPRLPSVYSCDLKVQAFGGREDQSLPQVLVSAPAAVTNRP